MASNELVINFNAETSDAMHKIGGLKGALGDIGNFAKGALTVGLGAAVVGVGALAGGLAASVKAAMDAEQGQAALAAVLASTAGKAGVTADMANELASSLQNVTRFEDDAILGAENLLLTFTNIGKDVFPAATETVLNMSQALGQDLKSSATQLGKALNDPINGMTALSRVGVTFTEAQKEQIKALQESGDLMGAQKIILQELETEFGNAARAAGDTFAGKLDILKNKFGDIMEAVGGVLIPVLTQAADAIIQVMGNPAVQAAVEKFGATILQTIDALKNIDLSGVMATIEGLFTGVGAENGFMTWLGELGGAIQSAAEQIGTALVPAMEALAPILNQIGAVLGPIISQALAMIGEEIVTRTIPNFAKLVTQFLETIPPTVEFAKVVAGQLNTAFKAAGELWNKLVQGFQDALKWVDEVKGTLERLAESLRTTVGDAFMWFKDNILTPISDAIAGFAAQVQKAIDLLRQLASFGNPFGNPFGGGGTPPPPGFLDTGGGFGGRVGDSGRGGVTVNVNYAPTVSLMDEAEAETKLKPFIREAVRAAVMGI